MKESAERGKWEKRKEPKESPMTADSEEDDDYFGNSTNRPGKDRARNSDVTPTGLGRQQKPVHFGPPLPVGATNQGGWNTSRGDSANTSPASSPISIRGSLPNASSSAFTSARSSANHSPLSSPDILRSSDRQRRGINSSV
ncbi:hypothetical protein CBS101457_001211 [Exobasidium rhododendri]|nr:hypothetical protein CBS101457_001211 [Exobasidium rhododendri]